MGGSENEAEKAYEYEENQTENAGAGLRDRQGDRHDPGGARSENGTGSVETGHLSVRVRKPAIRRVSAFRLQSFGYFAGSEPKKRRISLAAQSLRS